MKCWILTDFSKEVQASVASKAKTDIGGLLGNLPEWCEVVNIYDLAIEIDTHGSGKIWHAGKYVDRPDAALCLYVGLVAGMGSKYAVQILDQLESLGTFCMINSRQLMTTGDKLKCSQLLAKAGINTPKTVLLSDWIPTSMVVESLGLPMVVKPVDGSEGRGVCLVHSEEELKKMLADKDDSTTLIAQQYISTSKGRDLRIMLIGDEVAFCEIRDNTKSNDFRSNVSAGGDANMATPPEEALTIARQVRRVLGLNMCSVDFLFEDDGFTVGEVNSLPGFPENQPYEGELMIVRYPRLFIGYLMNLLKTRKE